MIEFIALILVHTIDPIVFVCVLLIFLVKKNRIIYPLIIGIVMGLLSAWLSEANGRGANYVIHIITTIIAAYIIYGISSSADKLRRYFLNRSGHVIEVDKE
jgi:uncharacterized RDD family membrane protein YckC